MKKDFTPFLPRVVPSLFQLATLNPETGVSGAATEDSLADVLSEVKNQPGAGETSRININTDETEEKDVAIQMLAVFIDELGGGYADYVEQTSQVLLPLVDYDLNDSVRNSVAGCFPGLIKCAKEANPNNRDYLLQMGKTYTEAIWKAIKKEHETESLICQIQALKDIIEEVGNGFFTDVNQINELAKLGLEQVKNSDERIGENNQMVKN
jgi:hypothetical protein